MFLNRFLPQFPNPCSPYSLSKSLFTFIFHDHLSTSPYFFSSYFYPSFVFWVSSWHPITHPGISELQIFLLAIKWPCGWVWSPVGAVKCWLLFLTVHMPSLSSCSYCYWPNHSFISVSQPCHIVAHTKNNIIYSVHRTCQGRRKFILDLSVPPLDCTNILKSQ